MPHLDDIRCKHCNAMVALIARASIVGRFTLKCKHCGVLLVLWPAQRQTLTIKVNECQPSQ